MSRMTGFLMWLVFFAGFSEYVQADNRNSNQCVRDGGAHTHFGGLVCDVKVNVGKTSHLARIVVHPTGLIAIEHLNQKHSKLIQPILQEFINHQLCDLADTAKWMIVRKNKRGLPCLVVCRNNPLGTRLRIENGNVTAKHTRSRGQAAWTKMEYHQKALGKTLLRRVQKKTWSKPKSTLLTTEVWHFTWGKIGRQFFPKLLVVEKTDWDLPESVSTVGRRTPRKTRITLHFRNFRYFRSTDRVLLAHSSDTSSLPAES